MLNGIAEKLETGNVCAEDLDSSLNELLAYSKKHFTDEEQIMSKFNLDESFISLHKMEHHSFIYDITSMKNKIIVSDELIDRA